jgi:hypothetical protein
MSSRYPSARRERSPIGGTARHVDVMLPSADTNRSNSSCRGNGRAQADISTALVAEGQLAPQWDKAVQTLGTPGPRSIDRA